MYGSQPGTSQHGHQSLRNHGHVNQYCVTLLNPKAFQKPGNPGHPVLEFRIRELKNRVRNGAIVDYCRLVSTALINVVIHRIETSV